MTRIINKVKKIVGERTNRPVGAYTALMNNTDILIYLQNAGITGYTWKELQPLVKQHHGSISGALSNFHKQRMIYMTTKKRKGSSVYIHAMYKSDLPKELIVDKPRANKSRQLLDAIVEAFDAGRDLTDLINQARE